MFCNRIKHRMADLGISAQKLAWLIGISQQTFSSQMLKDNFNEAQMVEIADLLDCNLVLDIIPRNGLKSVYSGYTKEDWEREKVLRKGRKRSK